MTTAKIDLKQYIRNIPDFPKPGILYYDISTLMRNADAWQIAMGRLAAAVAPWAPDMLAAIESRGFPDGGTACQPPGLWPGHAAQARQVARWHCILQL